MQAATAASPAIRFHSVTTSAFARAGDLLLKAATSAPFEGRPMYAALRALPIPDEPVARLFHAASMLREHRGDGHIAALMVEGVARLEAHVLLALDMNCSIKKRDVTIVMGKRYC